MGKKKLSYTPSKSEFILLCLLLFIGIGALMLTYLVLPAWNDYKDTLGRYEQRQLELEDLKTEYESLDEYKLRVSEIERELEGLGTRIPSYHSQEEVIAALNSVSAQSGLSLLSISFSGPVTQDKAVFLASLSHASGSGSQQSGGFITSERVTLRFTGTFDSLRNFIQAYELNSRQVCFTDTTVTADEEGTLSGSATMLVFSLADETDAQQEHPSYHYDAPEASGKDDPFAPSQSYTAHANAGSASTQTDFFIIINTYDDNANKIQMGKYTVASTQIASDRNEGVFANFNISGSGNELSYSYQLGDRSYSGTLEHSGDTVNLSILSRSRKNDRDNVGVTLNVANDSEKEIAITVKNDDPINPRFVMGTISGAVQVIS